MWHCDLNHNTSARQSTHANRTSKRSGFFYFIFLVLFLVLCQTTLAARSDRSIPRHSCQKDFQNCKNNRACYAAYKTVKRKCKVNATNRCSAKPEYLTLCLINVEIMQNGFFHHDDEKKCGCASGSLKTVKRCLDVYNRVFANPCYDKSLAAREEEIKLGAVTLRAAVDTDGGDGLDVVSSATENLAKGLPGDNVINVDLTTAMTVASKPERTEVNKDVAKKDPHATEDDCLDIDYMFFEVGHPDPSRNNDDVIQDEIILTEETDDVDEVIEVTKTENETQRNVTEELQLFRNEVIVPEGRISAVVQQDDVDTRPENNAGSTTLNPSTQRPTPTLSISVRFQSLLECRGICFSAIALVAGLAVLSFFAIGGFLLHRRKQKRGYSSGKLEKTHTSIVRSSYKHKGDRTKSRIHV